MELKIQDYGIIGNCYASALISRCGSIDWLCLPEADSPPIFASLLDKLQGGSFSIHAPDIQSTSRRYLPDTPVLETIFTTASGRFRLLDAMPVLEPGRNPGLNPDHEILRCIEHVQGEPLVSIEIDGVNGFQGRRLAFNSRGRLGWHTRHGNGAIYIGADLLLENDGCRLFATCRLQRGERKWLSMTYHDGDIASLPPLGEEAARRLESTERWWKEWCGQIKFRGVYADAVKRSAITLRLLTFPLSGALIAAPTASLPEKPGGPMNWDYRYCWLRDAAWAVVAYMNIGLFDEARSFFDWLMLAGKTTAPELNVMYDIFGRAAVKERLHPNWAGYRHSQPVRTGNDLVKQRQLDVYGEVLWAVSRLIGVSGLQLQPDEKKLLAGFGKVICEQWRAPDNGIWEIRGARRHYTFSKVQAWFVLDCLIKLAEEGRITVPGGYYRQVREDIRRTIEASGYHTVSGCYAGVLNHENLDAALLLLPTIGYTSAGSPRMRALWSEIKAHLVKNGLVHRYSENFIGSPTGEGAFIICSFWAVEYLTRLGDRQEARAFFERALSCANDLQLMSEEVDPETGDLLGNFPQTFSHTGLINAAVTLENAGGRHGNDIAA